MSNDKKAVSQKTESKKKGFWQVLVEKMDKTMIEKAKQSPCCGKDAKGGKCC